jgi:hypothetical protein
MQIAETTFAKSPVKAVPALKGVWTGPRLAEAARRAARRTMDSSWAGLLDAPAAAGEPDDVLTLLTYCYLAGVFHSSDAARRPQHDEALAFLRGRGGFTPEELRRFRRRERRALNDALTHALLLLAGTGGAEAAGAGPRLNFRRLEPYYLEAQDRIDRAIVLDSMALDD